MNTSTPPASGPDDQQDTIKVYGSLSQIDTDLGAARNALAIAMRDYAMSQTPELKTAMIQAQAEVHRLEQEYKESRQLLQEYICAKQKNQGQNIILGRSR